MRRKILRISNHARRDPPTIPFSSEALQATLLRLQNEWAMVQASRDRDAIYRYLAAVFEVVGMVGRGRQGRQARLSGPAPTRIQIDKGAGTVCRYDPLHVRSRKGRRPDTKQMVAGAAVSRQRTRTWMSRWVISSCAGAASTYARGGLPGVWGEASIEAQRVCSREIGFESYCPTH